jgi:RND family efflux transporter MFP subunit
MRRMTATLVALATTAMALGFACGQAPTHGTVTVERQDFRVRVTADGVLEAVESTALAPPLNIRRPFTVAWIIDDGVAVKQGDVVVRFDAIEFEQQLERAMSERRTSQRRIDRSNTERDVTIEKLDLDAAMSQMELEHAESFQTLDTTVFSRMEILESSIDTELARHKADHALESKDIEAQLAQAEIDLHRIAQQRADLQISQAEDGLEHLEIIAPYDGLVVLEREWDGTPTRSGDVAWPGSTLARLPDVHRMQAEVWVLEADAGGLETGQAATIRLEASPATEWAATVESVDPLAAPRQQGVPVQYFRCVLALETTDPGVMKPGARVQAEIVIADLEDAVVVPRYAIATSDEGTKVLREGPDGPEIVPVTLGPSAAGRVVVTDGLEAGDQLVIDAINGRNANGGGRSEPAAPAVTASPGG